jgi:hypothetical protein
MSYARINGRNVSWQWLRKHPEELRAYLAHGRRIDKHERPRKGRSDFRSAADDRREQIEVVQELAWKFDGIRLSKSAAAKILRESRIK